MKKFIFITLLFVASCAEKVPEHIQKTDSAEDAVMYIEAYQGDINEFRLELKDEVMLRGQRAKTELAVGYIGKAIQKTKGWYFDGYEARPDSVRWYKFKTQ